MAMEEECARCGIEPENGELYWNNGTGGGVCVPCDILLSTEAVERATAETARLCRAALRTGLAADGIPFDRQ